MPVVCRTRPVAGDGINAVTPHSIKVFNAAKDPYRVASHQSIPFPYPFEVCDASRALIKMVAEIAFSEKSRNAITYHRMQITSIYPLTLMRPGMPGTKSNILVLVVKHERNEAVRQEAANFFQDRFASIARKQRTYVPFVVELQNQRACYTADEWDFVPGITDALKAIMAVKDIIKAEATKLVPREQLTAITYRLIDRACALKGPHLPTVMVLVKPNSCAKWHEVERQIKDAVNQAGRGKKDMEVYLEFVTGDKPRTRAEEVMRIMTLAPYLHIGSPSTKEFGTPLLNPRLSAQLEKKLKDSLSSLSSQQGASGPEVESYLNHVAAHGTFLRMQ